MLSLFKMTEKQLSKLASIQKKIEELLDDNKKFRIIIYGREDGHLDAESQEPI